MCKISIWCDVVIVDLTELFFLETLSPRNSRKNPPFPGASRPSKGLLLLLLLECSSDRNTGSFSNNHRPKGPRPKALRLKAQGLCFYTRGSSQRTRSCPCALRLNQSGKRSSVLRPILSLPSYYITLFLQPQPPPGVCPWPLHFHASLLHWFPFAIFFLPYWSFFRQR